MRNKKTAPRTRKYQAASSPQLSGLIAREKNAMQSAVTESALDNRFHSTDLPASFTGVPDGGAWERFPRFRETALLVSHHGADFLDNVRRDLLHVMDCSRVFGDELQRFFFSFSTDYTFALESYVPATHCLRHVAPPPLMVCLCLKSGRLTDASCLDESTASGGNIGCGSPSCVGSSRTVRRGARLRGHRDPDPHHQEAAEKAPPRIRAHRAMREWVRGYTPAAHGIRFRTAARIRSSSPATVSRRSARRVDSTIPSATSA